MDELLTRVSHDLLARVTGPMSLRLVLQPAMAIILGIRAGLHDAKEGRPAYFWTILTSSNNRENLLREGWTAVGKVFVAAVLIDIVYQFIVLGFVYPGEALLVAFILACVPYSLVRGFVDRMARSRQRLRA